MQSSVVQKMWEAKSSQQHTACFFLSTQTSEIRYKLLKTTGAPLRVPGSPNKLQASEGLPVICPRVWMQSLGSPHHCLFWLYDKMTEHLSFWILGCHLSFSMEFCFFFFSSFLHKMIYLRKESLNLVIPSEESKSSLHLSPPSSTLDITACFSQD